MRALRIVARTIVLLIVVLVVVFLGRFAWSYGTMAWTWASQAIHAAPPPAPTTPAPVAPAPKQEPASPTPTPPPAQPAPQIVKETVVKEVPKEIIKEVPGPTKEIPTGLQCGVGTLASDGKCVPTPTSSKLYVSDLQVADITPTSATVTIVTVNTGKGNQQYDVMAKASSTSTWMKVGTFTHMGEGRSVGQTSLTDLKSGASYDVKVIWSGTDAASASFTTSTTPTPVPPPAPTPTPTTIVAKAVSLVSDNAQHERFRTTNGEERIRLTIKSLGTQPAGRRVWVEQAQAGISHYWLIGKVGDSSLELSNTFITSSGPWFKVHVESSVAEPGATQQVHPDLPGGAAYTVSTADWYKAENR